MFNIYWICLDKPLEPLDLDRHHTLQIFSKRLLERNSKITLKTINSTTTTYMALGQGDLIHHIKDGNNVDVTSVKPLIELITQSCCINFKEFMDNNTPG